MRHILLAAAVLAASPASAGQMLVPDGSRADVRAGLPLRLARAPWLRRLRPAVQAQSRRHHRWGYCRRASRNAAGQCLLRGRCLATPWTKSQMRTRKA